MNLNFNRIWGVILRHLYNFRRAYDRMSDVFFYPAIDIFVWGLAISAINARGNKVFEVAAILIGLILWYAIWRGQYEITVNLLEELWSENLTNLLSTPLNLGEWIIGFMSLGFIKLVMNILFAALLAFILYQVSVFTLGFYLIPFIVSLLITGWVSGLFFAGFFLRYGTNIQTLAWAGGALLMPFSSVFYPVSSLPSWMQIIARFVPSAYIFEGMRQVLSTHSLDTANLYKSFLLNAVYFILALGFFLKSFQKAKEQGLAHLK